MSTSGDNLLAIIDRIAERAMERGERFATAIPAHVARKAVQQSAEAVAAARREGWAQAIEALRALAAESDVTEPRPWTDQGVYLEAAEALEDLLALTEERP